MQTFQPIFFIPTILIGKIEFHNPPPPPPHPTFSDLELGWRGHKVSAKQRTLASFSTDHDEMCFGGVEAFQVEHLYTIFEWDLKKKQGKWLLFSDCVKNKSTKQPCNQPTTNQTETTKPQHPVMLACIWTLMKSIRFKRGIVIDTIVLYILTLVLFTWTLIQGHRSSRKQKFCSNYLTQFLIDFAGIWWTFEICWCDELRALFIVFIDYSSEGTLLMWFYKKKNFIADLCLDIFRPISFRLGIMI